MTTPVVAVIGASQTPPDHPDYQDSRELGKLLARANLTVATGGYGGLMEAVSEGAKAAGGQVIGVTAPAVFPARRGPNPHVDVELPTDSITERIHRLITMADAVVALSGSIGTFTELMMAWNVAFVARFSDRPPPLVVAVGLGWGEVVALLAERLGTDGSLVKCVSTYAEAAAMVDAHLRS